MFHNTCARIGLIAIQPLFAQPAVDSLAQQRSEEEAWPVVAVWQVGGLKDKPNEGLRMAVWSDGTILFPSRRDRLGQHMLVGRVRPGDVDAMLKSIEALGFFEESRSMIVPDGDYATIAVRSGDKRTARSWHECLLPGFGGDLNRDAAYREFVQVWKKTSAAIEGLAPIEVHRLDEQKPVQGQFRGYHTNQPLGTLWMRAENWIRRP